MTVAEAAEYLDVTRQTIAHHIKEGRLPHERLGRSYALRRVDVESFRPPKAGWRKGRLRKVPTPPEAPGDA